ncbi:MAG: hypothetical protein KF718_21695 [Polyangiaceae bacterium]|nr:hypothetical protein [Polyangiaceae bacterium]
MTDLPADSSGRLRISRLHTLGGATLIGATGFVTGARSAWPDYLRGQLAEAPALEALASREAHEVLVFALLGLVLLHVGGVMLQQVRKGGVLRRMVPFLK